MDNESIIKNIEWIPNPSLESKARSGPGRPPSKDKSARYLETGTTLVKAPGNHREKIVAICNEAGISRTALYNIAMSELIASHENNKGFIR